MNSSITRSSRRLASHRPSVLETATTTYRVDQEDSSESDADDTPLMHLLPDSRRKSAVNSSDTKSNASLRISNQGHALGSSSEEEEFVDDVPSPKKSAHRKITPPSASSEARNGRRGGPVMLAQMRQSSTPSSDTESDDIAKGTKEGASSKSRIFRRKKTPLSSEDDTDVEPTLPKKKTQSKKSRDSDEEYLFDENEDDNDDSTNSSSNDSSEDSFVGDIDNDSDAEMIMKKKTGRSGDRPLTVGIVEDVGDRDDDSDDSEHIPILKPSPALNDIQPRRRRTMDDSSASSNDSSIYVLPLTSSSQKKRQSPKSSSRSRAHCIRCDSTKDVVTDEDLPEIHVCFFPPDNQNKQCFSLDTLRKIALAQPVPPLVSTNGTIQRAKTSFLQPPHFRTTMSDDLLDQIASRFGRDALDIHGEYYRRAAQQATDGTWSEEPAGTSVLLAQSESIIHQLERYIRSRMGNQDLYCCPICYVVAHERLMVDEANDDDDDSKHRLEDKEYVTDFFLDPMAVLRDAGEIVDPFRIASTFCFKKITQVKEHLRNDHSISTTKVQGSDMYVRYKIRSQDGLLQRFLNQNSGKYAPTRQGEMLKYWYQGNNSDFVLLLSLISHAALCRKIVKGVDVSSRSEDRDAVEAAEEYLRPAWTFFESFSNEESAIWNTVASPFLKQSQDEIRDFIAGDDYASEGEEEIGDEPISHRALLMQSEMEDFRREQDADRKLAAHYEKMVRDLQSDDSINEEEKLPYSASSYADDNDGSQYNSNHESQNQSSDSDEADEWHRTIMNKRVGKLKLQSSHERSLGRRRVSLSTSKVSPKKRAVVELLGSSDDDEASWLPSSTPLVHKRPAVRESDEDL